MRLIPRFFRRISFPVGSSGQTLIISPRVLKVFRKHIQKNSSTPEGGGVLLARFSLPQIEIVLATEPRPEDTRQRHLFISDPQQRNHIVEKSFRKGIHFVGEWHTHPQREPSPSALDVKSMYDLFIKSTHELNFFVMIIVGNTTNELSLWVSLHDAQEVHRLYL